MYISFQFIFLYTVFFFSFSFQFFVFFSLVFDLTLFENHGSSSIVRIMAYRTDTTVNMSREKGTPVPFRFMLLLALIVRVLLDGSSSSSTSLFSCILHCLSDEKCVVRVTELIPPLNVHRETKKKTC